MNRRTFLEYFGCSCCGILMNSCASVPITERKQLKLIPESMLNRQAAQIYEQVKAKAMNEEEINGNEGYAGFNQFLKRKNINHRSRVTNKHT